MFPQICMNLRGCVLRTRFEDVVVISTSTLNVFTDVYPVVLGYIIRRVITPNQDLIDKVL